MHVSVRVQLGLRGTQPLLNRSPRGLLIESARDLAEFNAPQPGNWYSINRPILPGLCGIQLGLRGTQPLYIESARDLAELYYHWAGLGTS